MALPQESFYTIEDIYALPDGERAELINGRLYCMAPPSRIHQKITGRLYQEIANYISRKGGSCEVYAAPFAVFLNEDDTTCVEPDISVICDPDKLNEKGCSRAAAAWIILSSCLNTVPRASGNTGSSIRTRIGSWSGVLKLKIRTNTRSMTK